MDMVWYICCFAAGALSGSMFSEVGKDIYRKIKITIAKFRSPIKQTMGQDGLIHTQYKKKRPWHKKRKVLSYDEIKKINRF